MNVQSLGFRTDLIFHRSEGEVVDRGVKKLVIVADEGYFAKGIYRSVGFAVVEKSVGVGLKQVAQPL